MWSRRGSTTTASRSRPFIRRGQPMRCVLQISRQSWKSPGRKPHVIIVNTCSQQQGWNYRRPSRRANPTLTTSSTETIEQRKPHDSRSPPSSEEGGLSCATSYRPPTTPAKVPEGDHIASSSTHAHRMARTTATHHNEHTRPWRGARAW